MLRRLGVLCLVAALGMASAQEAQVPSPFRGGWASSIAQCGKHHEGELAITATRVDFYASRGKVLSIRSIGPRDIEIELESTGEGVVRRNTRRFVLSDDGHSLTNVLGSTGLTRVRCK
jgi:hypothetical protein